MLRLHRCSLKRVIKVLGVLSVVWLGWHSVTRLVETQHQQLNGSVAVEYQTTRSSAEVIVEKPVVEKGNAGSTRTTNSALKLMVKDMNYTINTSMTDFVAEQTFHEYVSQIDVYCKEQVRIGNVTDGGWDVCVAHPYKPSKPCLVYSFGIGDNWSFDDGIATNYGCTVRSFDPSIKKQNHKRNERIYFYDVGVASEDVHNKTTGWTFKTLKSIINMCGDEQEIIDYLKLDVESNEWAVLETVLADDNILGKVKQLAIEIHTRELNEEQSNVHDYYRYWKILDRLEQFGFRKWYWHFNTWGFFPNRDSTKYISCCYELVYINVNYL